MPVENQIIIWSGFIIFIFLMLAIDLGIFHKKAHEIEIKEALIWSAVWVGLSLTFNVAIYFWRGPDVALEFMTGYLIEKSLSVDNLFVFLIIFSYFDVPAAYQHKVLFWGIVGALVLRAVFIFSGVALIHKFGWIIYIFGIFLIYTGLRLAFQKTRQVSPEKNILLRLFKKIVPTVDNYEGARFMARIDNKYVATPLILVLLVIETTDLMFALDSIPAILAITVDPFVVFSSNVFAIMGLRALYFALAGVMRMFRYLNYGLAAILAFIGFKMLLAEFYEIPVAMALGVVAVVLSLSIVLSWLASVHQNNRNGAHSNFK